MSVAEPDYIRAHRYCTCNRKELFRSGLCGCFYCLSTYAPEEIDAWIDDHAMDGRAGKTALCPGCGIDSVLGSAAEFPLKGPLLAQMHDHWFSAVDDAGESDHHGPYA